MKAHAQLSLDGRWLAYDTNATGSTFQIVVQPFPDAAQGKWQVTSKGGVDTASYIIGRPALFRIARPVAATKLGMMLAARFQRSAFGDQLSEIGNLFSVTSSQNAKKSRRKSLCAHP